MKRKIAGLLMLFCLIAPIIATYSWLQYQKLLVRREVRRQLVAGMDKEELVLLKFTEEEARANLHWKGADEFEYHGQMYDIVEAETRGDTLYYSCWWDHEEAQLDRHIKDILAYVLGKDTHNKETQKRLAHFFRSLYFLNASLWELALGEPAGSVIYSYLMYWPSVYWPPLVPPPERCTRIFPEHSPAL